MSHTNGVLHEGLKTWCVKWYGWVLNDLLEMFKYDCHILLLGQRISHAGSIYLEWGCSRRPEDY